MADKKIKIKIEKEKLRPKEPAPILPSKTFEDKTRKRQPKHKKDPRRRSESESED